MTTLYCREYPFLKLGPGILGPEHEIKFVNGFAEIANDDPHYAEKLRWTTALGTPPIENLGDNSEGQVAGDPSALDCPVCGKSFGTKPKLNGHLLSHRPKR